MKHRIACEIYYVQILNDARSNTQNRLTSQKIQVKLLYEVKSYKITSHL